MLSFHKMRIEGFASIKYLEFDWGARERGITIISARNGSGKSKLINALYWALFGDSISGAVGMWEHIRPKEYNGTLVEINFEKDGEEYKIIRCFEYKGKVEGRAGKNGLFFYSGGKLDPGRDKKGVQSRINRLISYSKELFLNTVIFGQKQQRLMDDKSSNKKKFFEEAFEVTIFQDAYTRANNLFSKISGEFNSLQSEEKALKRDIANYKERIEISKNLERSWHKAHKEKIKSMLENIQDLEQELEDSEDSKNDSIWEYEDQLKKLVEERGCYKNVEKEYNECQSDISRLRTDISLDEAAIKGCKKHIAVYTKNIETFPDVCEECGRPYSKKDKEKATETFRARIDGFNRDIKAYTLAREQHEKQLLAKLERFSSLNQMKKEYLDLLSKISALENKILEAKKDTKLAESLKSKIEREKEKLIRVKLERYEPEPGTKIEDLQSKLDSFTKKIKVIRKKLVKLQVEINRVNFAKETFSNKGIKPWLFNMLLEQVNSRLGDYENLSGFKVVFWVDMESANGDIRVLVNRYGTEVPYEDLSGGQQQLINLTTIFAINEVVQETKPCALFIGDELFESLDTTNVEVVANILQDKAQEKNIFLVTHLLDFNIQNSAIVRLENVNGFTTLLS